MSALLRHLAGSTTFPGGYASDHVREPWPPGEEREVEAHVGVYLVDTFPESFEVLRAPEAEELEPEPTLPEPFTDPSDLAAALTMPVSDLVSPIRQGVYDRHLMPMWLLEKAREGGPRKTVVENLLARARRIQVPLEGLEDESTPPAPVDPSPPTDPPAGA